METIAQLCEQLGSPDQIKAYQARRALAVRVAAAGAAGKEAERAALASQLAAELNAENEGKDDKGKVTKNKRYSVAVRNEICRSLADVGTDAEIATLAQALPEFEVREMARFALARNPSAAATAALGDAAQKTVGVEFRVGTIGSLVKRSNGNVVEALLQCAGDSSGEVRLASADALAQQPLAAADAILTQMCKDLGPTNARAVKRLNIARLQLAQTLTKAGQKDSARGIYQAIASDGADEAQKHAARSALEQLG